MLSAQAARCPYPACATVVVTVMKWSDASPRLLYTHEEVTRVFRRKLIAEVPAFLFAQAILAMSIYAAVYAIHHVSEAPPPPNIVESFAEVGIGIGAVGLGLPAAFVTLALITLGYRRLRRDRESLRHLRHVAEAHVSGFRLVPCQRAYRV